MGGRQRESLIFFPPADFVRIEREYSKFCVTAFDYQSATRSSGIKRRFQRFQYSSCGAPRVDYDASFCPVLLGINNISRSGHTRRVNALFNIHCCTGVVKINSLTQSIRKIISTQRNRLENFSVLLMANVFAAGIGFVTTVKIVNTLGSARFGEFAYALAIGGIIAVNVRFGMDRSLIRDLVHFPERFTETLAASLLARGLLLVVCIAGFLLAIVVLPKDTLEISWGMFLVILATTLNPLQIANVFDVWEIQGWHALYGCVEKAVYFTMIWAVVLWAPQRLDLLWIGSALLVTTLLFIFLQYRRAWYRLKPELHTMPLGKIMRTALSLIAGNKWLWMASLAALGITTLNQLVLKHFSGFSDLGVYAASFQLVGIGNILLKNIARIGRPILARYTVPFAVNTQATVRFMAIYVAVALLAVGMIALPAIAIPKLILQTLFTAEYTSGFWVLRLFGVYLLLRVFDAILGQYVVLVRMDRVFFATSVAAGLVGLICSIILIPPYGGVGAALSLLIGEIIFSTLYVLATLVYMKQNSKSRQPEEIFNTVENKAFLTAGSKRLEE